MKKFLVFVLALAGVLGFTLPVSVHAQGPSPYNGVFELELDGWVGDGGTYGVFVGMRIKSGSYSFPCGFTVEYALHKYDYTEHLTGRVHYKPHATYPASINGEETKYYFTMDDDRPFLLLDEEALDFRPAGMASMTVTITPDNSYYRPFFERILLDAAPFIKRLHDSGDVYLKGEPVGRPPEEWSFNYFIN